MTRKHIVGIVMAAIAALTICLSASGALPPGVTEEDMKYIMPLSQVKAGMKGYGLTVFKGVKIEKFDVEVLGILRSWNLGRHLILVKMNGGPITERQANIIQGMSGSPVYIDGKIIGAISMGMSWAKDPICMVTPIEDVLYALDPNLPDQPSGLSSTEALLDSPINIGGEVITRVEMRKSGVDKPAPKGTLVMTPLMTPVMVSGLSGKNMDRLAELFEPYGLVPVAGPGGKADVIPVELQPGAAVGMALGTGDVDMTAVGTVTYRRGNKITAFGHPFLMIGPIDAPMYTAYIYDVFPSYQTSMKLSAPMQDIGRIFADMPWSVAGEIGPKAKMVPVVVEVENRALGINNTFRANLINHPLMTPELILTVAPQGIQNVQVIPGDVTARVHTTVVADKIGKIECDNICTAQYRIENSACADLAEILRILSRNRFYPLDIKSVHMSVVIESGRTTAEIERISVDKSRYEPGETVLVSVELRPYKKNKIVKTLQVQIPEDAPDGFLTLRVNGGLVGGEETPVTVSPEGTGAKVTPLPGGTAENIRQMIDKYLSREQNNELIARLLLPTPAVSINGETFAGLPETIAGVMKSPKATNLKLDREEVKSVVATDYILTGQQSMTIKVEQNRNGEKRESGQNQQNSSNKSDSPKPVQAADAGSFVTTSFTPGVPAWKSVRIPTPAPDAPAEAAQQADKANGQKPEQKQDEKTETPQVEKPVIRQPAVWQQKTRDDFASGKFEGAAVSTGDDVRMVQAITKLSALPESYVWCVIPDGNGGVFAGTGDNGIVYRIDETGTSSVFCETGEMEVHSLVMDSKGNLYAATSPNGRIYRISGDGQKELVFDAPERYAVTLAADSKDNIYVGVGDSGMVYRISPEGGVIQFAELPNSSVLVLATDKQDNVYAGTGKGGVVFRITPGGLVTPLYNSAEKSIASLSVDSKGNIYAGTGEEKGIIYRISPSGTVKPVFDKAPKALSLTIDTQDSVYVVSDESIYKILPDEKVMSLDTRRAATQFISITIDPNGRIFAGAANSAAVYSSLPMTAGTFESSVYDAGLKSQWSTISWIGNVPEGTSIEVQTRSGNIAKPDSSWSEWSPAYTNAFSQQIVSPAARYIQYRAIMKTTNGFTPVLRQVSITGLTENRVPVVKINEPGQGAAISKSVEIKWTGEDPDKDTLSYDLFYSGDGGNTWLPLDGDFKQVQTETTAPQQQQQTPPQGGVGMEINIEGPNIPDPDEMLAQLTAELEKHPEIPPEIKQQMLEQAPAAIAKAVAEAKAKQQGDKPEQEKQPEQKESTVTTKQTTYKWDTTKVPDGVYMIKVVANDRASNPVGYLTAEDILDPIVVANTAPQLVVMKRQIKVNDDKTATINGYVNNSFIPITGVQYKVDDGDWMGAASVDGIYNSASEYFTIQTKALKAGKHKVEIKAIDAAGNQVSTSVEVEVK